MDLSTDSLEHVAGTLLLARKAYDAETTKPFKNYTLHTLCLMYITLALTPPVSCNNSAIPEPSDADIFFLELET